MNGHTITFTNAHVPAAAQVPTGSGILPAVQTDGNGNSIVYLQTATIADTLNAIDLASGVQTASNWPASRHLPLRRALPSSVNANGTLKLSTGTAADLISAAAPATRWPSSVSTVRPVTAVPSMLPVPQELAASTARP